MLFNSYQFLFLFFPISALGFFVIARKSHGLAAGWLACASLVFYGWWSLNYIPLLLSSIAFNYWAGWKISHSGQPLRKRWLIFSLTANLALLGYFKYADFFIASVNAAANVEWPLLKIVLPIGISFFTFTQIAFLVDTYQGKVQEYRFVNYVLFVTYFPHLVAGPVLHHREMMPQFDDPANYRFSAKNLAIGTAIFAIGLAKKVLIADNLAPHASFVFDRADSLSFLTVWGGVLAYAFQLYFDFSGYSDMAIGLSRMFGIKLPLNFNSPYKAKNIIEFWRRWHITLSRFLRDYLYVPLGGNRKGPVRRYANLMATMVLGGLWHGAGWNFIIWGGLHGAYLMVNHAWIAFSARIGIQSQTRAWKFFGITLTFLAVCFAWVFFRASDPDRAMQLVYGMAGVYGISIPESIGAYLGNGKEILEALGATFYLGGGTQFVQTYVWVLFAGMIAFLMPNTQEIMGRFAPAFDYQPEKEILRQLIWRPDRKWACYIGILVLLSLLSLSRPTEFLYFQF